MKPAPLRLLQILMAVLALLAGAAPGIAQDLGRFLSDLAPETLVEGADGFGAVREDVAVAPVLKGGETVAWAFLTSDFVGTTGYSGKPIHVVAAISEDAVLTGAALVEHSEPIVLIGIPDAKMRATDRKLCRARPEGRGGVGRLGARAGHHLRRHRHGHGD